MIRERKRFKYREKESKNKRERKRERRSLRKEQKERERKRKKEWFRPSIEPITFPTMSRYATCYATDASLAFHRVATTVKKKCCITRCGMFYVFLYVCLRNMRSKFHTN